MQSVVLCYAPQDETAARELGRYLETNLDLEVSYGEAVVGPELDLVDGVERALSAQVAIVLLSPDSVPNHWRREKWEPVFFSKPYEFETLLAFVLVRDCRFPELLRRHSFFDGSRDLQAAARGLKRWLLRPARNIAPVAALPPELAELSARIADEPGIAECTPDLARQFAERCAVDFEAVYHFDCRGRSLAGLLGDIGYRASLKLPGTVDENAAAVRKWCASHRCLFLFDNVSPENRNRVSFGGRTSIMFTRSSESQPELSFDEIAAAFFASPRDNDQCLAMLGAVTRRFDELVHIEHAAALRLGWALVSVLKSAERFAEALEILAAMFEGARKAGDGHAQSRIEWERSWMQDYAAGRLLYTGAEPEQLEFAFA